MTKNVAFTKCGLTLAWALLSAGALAGQDAVVDEFYGRGVHQYFAGSFNQAAADLTAAIQGGTKDPRAYYFRALAEMRLGQQAAAQADLRTGAALESADIDGFYPVGKSLERVQGSTRMTIERHRAVARAEAYQRRYERDAVRYEQRRRAESQVLRSSGSTPIAAPAAAPLPAVIEATEEDPFADKAEKQPADEMPDEEQPAAAEKPAIEEPSDKDLFSDEPVKEDAEEMKADDEAGESDKPVESPEAKDAAPKSDDENPFADDPTEAKSE